MRHKLLSMTSAFVLFAAVPGLGLAQAFADKPIYANSITHALLPATSKSPHCGVMKDFVPVVGVFWYSMFIACNPGEPFDDVQGLLAYAKKKPGKLRDPRFPNLKTVEEQGFKGYDIT